MQTSEARGRRRCRTKVRRPVAHDAQESCSPAVVLLHAGAALIPDSPTAHAAGESPAWPDGKFGRYCFQPGGRWASKHLPACTELAPTKRDIAAVGGAVADGAAKKAKNAEAGDDDDDDDDAAAEAAATEEVAATEAAEDAVSTEAHASAARASAARESAFESAAQAEVAQVAAQLALGAEVDAQTSRLPRRRRRRQLGGRWMQQHTGQEGRSKS